MNINLFQLTSAGFKLSQTRVDLCPIYVNDSQSLFSGASGGSGRSFLRSAYVGEEWRSFHKACFNFGYFFLISHSLLIPLLSSEILAKVVGTCELHSSLSLPSVTSM